MVRKRVKTCGSGASLEIVKGLGFMNREISWERTEERELKVKGAEKNTYVQKKSVRLGQICTISL